MMLHERGGIFILTREEEITVERQPLVRQCVSADLKGMRKPKNSTQKKGRRGTTTTNTWNRHVPPGSRWSVVWDGLVVAAVGGGYG